MPMSRFTFSSRLAIVGLCLGAILLNGSLNGGLAQDAATEPNVVAPEVVKALQADETTRVIVALENPLPPSAALADLKRRGQAAIDRALDALSSDQFQLTEEYEAFFAFAAEITAQGLNALEELPSVVRIHPDIEFHVPDPGGVAGAGVAAQLAESVPLINADQVHSDGVNGGNVRIAVLDTGVDTDHPDFGSDTTGDRIVAQNCFLDNVTGSCPSSGDVAEDDNGHGTNVTGTAASDGSESSTGVAPASEIVAAKVLNSDGDGSFSDVLSALEWIQDNNDTLNVRVINMSFGGSPVEPPCDDDFSSMDAAIEQLRANGVISFAASGNNNEPSKISPPACISDAVSVGAVYDDDIGGVDFGVCEDTSTEPDKVACFTNGAPDLQGPGAAMTASGLDGGTSTFYGTSQASPAASGVALLLLDVDGSLSPDNIENTLKDTGVLVTDPKNDESRPRVDAKAAVDAVSPPSAPSDLTATTASSSQIDLSWTDNSDNEDGFRIIRDGSEIDTVGANTTSYSDTELSGDTQYCYEIVAFNAAGDSSPSNEDCATTDSASSSDAVFRVENDGDVYADGAYYCGLSSGCFNAGEGADIAERIEASEPVKPGDLVAIDPNREVTYRKSRQAYSNLVVGVVSTAPAITLGNTASELRALMNRPVIRPHRSVWVGRLAPDDGRHQIPSVDTTDALLLHETSTSMSAGDNQDAGVGVGVHRAPTLTLLVEYERADRVGNRLPGRPLMALMGRTPVKATTENGPIAPGDLLTSSSTPGHVMRCADPQVCKGALIGKALERLQADRGTIEMLLMH